MPRFRSSERQSEADPRARIVAIASSSYGPCAPASQAFRPPDLAADVRIPIGVPVHGSFGIAVRDGHVVERVFVSGLTARFGPSGATQHEPGFARLANERSPWQNDARTKIVFAFTSGCSGGEARAAVNALKAAL